MKFNAPVPKDERTCDGITFRTGTEMRHYLGLKTLQQSGEITKLQYEPKFVFVVNGVNVGSYRPDFTYLDTDSVLHVEDVKGWRRSAKTGKLLPRVDRGFKVTRLLMLACFGLDVDLV